MKTTTIRLGGTDYTIRRFNLGELEDLAVLIDETPKARRPFAIIRMALATATPAVADPKSIDASGDEISAAVSAIMELSGLRSAKPGETEQGQVTH